MSVFSKIPLFFRAFPQKFSSMSITCLARLVLLDFITLIDCESGVDSASKRN